MLGLLGLFQPIWKLRCADKMDRGIEGYIEVDRGKERNLHTQTLPRV